jgi:hypothetical protein
LLAGLPLPGGELPLIEDTSKWQLDFPAKQCNAMQMDSHAWQVYCALLPVHESVHLFREKNLNPKRAIISGRIDSSSTFR